MNNISSAAVTARENARQHGRFGEQIQTDQGDGVLSRIADDDVLADPRVVEALGGFELDGHQQEVARRLLSDDGLYAMGYVARFDGRGAFIADCGYWDAGDSRRYLASAVFSDDYGTPHNFDILRDANGRFVSADVSVNYVPPPPAGRFRISVGDDNIGHVSPEHYRAEGAPPLAAVIIAATNIDASRQRCDMAWARVDAAFKSASRTAPIAQ